MKKIIVIALLLGFSQSTYAITIGSLSSSDDGSTQIITDNLNGYDWLRWDVLKGLTYAQTVAITSTGGAYEGWGFATNTEALQFMNALVGPNPCTTTGSAQCQNLITGPNDMFGYGTLLGDSFTANNAYFSQDFAWFLSDNGIGADAGIINIYEGTSFGQTTHQGSISNEWGSIGNTDAYSSSGLSSSNSVGWLLYRPSNVSEPESLALIGLGLIALVISRRKKMSSVAA